MASVKRNLEPRDRILAPAAVRDATGKVVGVNLGAIVRRLILFEEVTLDSYAMRELPALIDALTPEGFMELLTAGPFTIRADAWVFGETGDGGWVPGWGAEPLPHLHYSFAPIVPHDRKANIQRSLGEIRDMELPTKLSQKVRNAVVDALVPFPEDAGTKTIDALPRDFMTNEGLVRVASVEGAKGQGRDLADAPFSITIEQVDEYVFRVETDLEEVARLSPQETDKVVQTGLLAIGGLNQRFEEMEV